MGLNNFIKIADKGLLKYPISALFIGYGFDFILKRSLQYNGMYGLYCGMAIMLFYLVWRPKQVKDQQEKQLKEQLAKAQEEIDKNAAN